VIGNGTRGIRSTNVILARDSLGERCLITGFATYAGNPGRSACGNPARDEQVSRPSLSRSATTAPTPVRGGDARQEADVAEPGDTILDNAADRLMVPLFNCRERCGELRMIARPSSG
jgi:hypothetical protein